MYWCILYPFPKEWMVPWLCCTFRVNQTIIFASSQWRNCGDDGSWVQGMVRRHLRWYCQLYSVKIMYINKPKWMYFICPTWKFHIQTANKTCQKAKQEWFGLGLFKQLFGGKTLELIMQKTLAFRNPFLFHPNVSPSFVVEFSTNRSTL